MRLGHRRSVFVFAFTLTHCTHEVDERGALAKAQDPVEATASRASVLCVCVDQCFKRCFNACIMPAFNACCLLNCPPASWCLGWQRYHALEWRGLDRMWTM